jgi:hypothetical protein
VTAPSNLPKGKSATSTRCAGRRHSLKEYAWATAEVETVINKPSVAGECLFDAACVYALSAAAAGRDPQLVFIEQEALADKYATRAIELLTRARTAGFFKNPANVGELKKGKDLDPLRLRADFQKLLTDLEDQATPRHE